MLRFNTILIQIILFTLSSCSLVNHKTSKPVDLVSSSEETPTHTSSGTPSVKESHKPFLVVSKFTGFNKSTIEKLKKATVKIDEVFASDCFEDFMVKRNLIQTNGKSNKEVVEHLRSTQAKVELVYYYKWFSKVHGYTYPNTDKIWLNGKYHTGTTVCSEASNLAHEGSHKVGYGHDFKATKRRPYSVPYSINAAWRVCCHD